MSKITKERINEIIDKVEYVTSPSLKQTFCIITLKNGFEVTGTSAVVEVSLYDKIIGERIALTKAKDKIWELEGYLLQQRLYEQKLEK